MQLVFSFVQINRDYDERRNVQRRGSVVRLAKLKCGLCSKANRLSKNIGQSQTRKGKTKLPRTLA